MRVIAKKHDRVYVVTDDVAWADDPSALGSVLDKRNNVLYPKQNVLSILVRGDWELCDMPANEVDKLLVGVERMERPSRPVAAASR